MDSEHPVDDFADLSDESSKGINLNALVGTEVTEKKLGENDIQTKCVVGALSGVILAGASYPFVVCVFGFLFTVATNFEVVYANFFDGLGTAGMIVLLGAAFGSIISSITGLFSMLIVLIVNRSLGNPLDGRSAAISAGRNMRFGESPPLG